MKKKEQKKDDDRKVVIYARKSKVTHKGDSISNQEEYCKEYARLHLHLPEDYEYGIYEDEGKSGFYSDRPDFQRMIHDVEAKKVRAIVCYKLDRISRRMSDLTNLIDYLNKYDVALLISSNNLNTMDSNSKMMIQMLGMIAEFERDIITERLQDNLMELSKDGRWMGGIAPTGFETERSKTGTGKKKNAYTYLVSIPDEKALVQRIFDEFLVQRCFNSVANALNEEGYTTKTGAKFKPRAIRDIIKNPIYCVADERAYQYFMDHDSSVYGDKEEYDGIHGIAVYNRTTQTKEETDDSTFLHPSFTSSTKYKDEDDWIIAVGRHEGFVSSEKWIEAQSLKEDIFNKYNRPHRATNALLSGLMYCPKCGAKLTVVSESNRYTHGKPRFKYCCPNAVRKGSCDFVAVHGVEMDEFVVNCLRQYSEGDGSDGFYNKVVEGDVTDQKRSDDIARQIDALGKEIESLEKDIKSQIKALRTAGEATRPYLQADIDEMAESINGKKKILAKLEMQAADNKREDKLLEEVAKVVDDFGELSKDASPEELTTLIKMVVARIVVTRDGKKEKAVIYFKGSKFDEYTDFFESGINVNDSISDVDAMCDRDTYCERDTHLRGDSASCRVLPEDD